jgi:membrane-associated phospholipid phosphatase
MRKFCREILIFLFVSIVSGHKADAQSAGTGQDTTFSVISTAGADKDSSAHVYRMNYKVSGIFCVVATAADIYAIPSIIKNKTDITDAELNALNPKAFNGLDHWALEQDPLRRNDYYKASDYMLPLIIASTGVLAFDRCIKKDWFRLLVMYYEMHAITFSIYNFSFFGPAFENKYRPIVYYSSLPNYVRNGGNERNSMYSGHTATAMASTFFMVKVYCDYHPDIGRTKYLLYAIASVPPILEGFLRVKALAHFPSDVLIGVSIGAVCGIVVPSLHKFRDPRLSIGICPTPVGPGLGVIWRPQGKHISPSTSAHHASVYGSAVTAQ